MDGKRIRRFFLRKYALFGALFFLSSEKREVFREKIDDLIIDSFKDEIEKFVDSYPTVLSEEETLRQLVDERKSICRFGDGEFKLIVGERHKSFQDVNQRLNERMLDVLKSNHPDILIGIHPVRSFDKLTRIWRKFIIRIGKEVLALLDLDRVYPSMGVFRELPGDDKDLFDQRIAAIKRLWQGRKVLFVVGKNSRFEFLEELFDNVESIDYVYGPPKNAFAEYDQILADVKTYSSDDYLVLLVLGPTATVMAYDLALAGYQAIDFGQMPGIYKKLKASFGDSCQQK